MRFLCVSWRNYGLKAEVHCTAHLPAESVCCQIGAMSKICGLSHLSTLACALVGPSASCGEEV